LSIELAITETVA